MTYRGHVKNGQIIFENPVPEVVVAIVEKSQPNGEDLNAMLLRHAGRGQNLPGDLASQHDQYAHGKPKR